MADPMELLGCVVNVKLPGGGGEVPALCLGYIDQPMYLVQFEDGTKGHVLSPLVSKAGSLQAGVMVSKLMRRCEVAAKGPVVVTKGGPDA